MPDPAREMLNEFAYDDLSPAAQEVCAPLLAAAVEYASLLRPSEAKVRGMHFLLEAKRCAVRAAAAQEQETR